MDLRNFQLSRVVLAFLLTLCAVSVCFAQINFSPSWGKRGSGLGGGGAGGGVRSQDTCKPSMDSLMYLYKLIQDEAQKIVDCEKFGN